MLTSVKCPVCGTICSDPPLYRYTTEEAAAHFCPVTRNADRHFRLKAVISRLWQGEECVILRCKECQFAFGHPFVGGDEAFYSILHEQQGYPNWRWDYDIALSEALNPLGKGRILDIGAGTGVFLRSLKQGWECYALEGSDTTRGPLEACGIRVFRDLTVAAKSETGSFQVITLFQVLEHIAEFRSILAQCRQLLCEGGRLMVTVPDGDAMILQEKLTGCPDMPPNHINKWTPHSLSRVLQEAGFHPQQAIFEPSSWGKLGNALYLRVMADSANKKSLAAQVYRVSYKPLRVLLLSALGLPALIRMLPYVQQLKKGGAFAMVAIA